MDGDRAVVQVFEGTSGIDNRSTTLEFTGEASAAGRAGLIHVAGWPAGSLTGLVGALGRPRHVALMLATPAAVPCRRCCAHLCRATCLAACSTARAAPSTAGELRASFAQRSCSATLVLPTKP